MYDTYILAVLEKVSVSVFSIAKTTVCPPVAELAPRKFGPLFFGRQSGPGWRDF